MEYIGKVVEMGNLSHDSRGILIEIRPNIFIQVIGFAQHDLAEMPNLIYKNIKLTIDIIDYQ